MSLEENVPHPPGTNTVKFHRKQFLAEHVGCCAMALVVGWGLLGGFGEGWLSNRTIRNDEETVHITFERFARRGGPTELRLRFAPRVSGQTLAIQLNQEFVESVKMERVTPQNRSMVVESNGATMVFDVDPDNADYSIVLEYKPLRMGSLHVAIRPVGGSALSFDQFVYP